MDIKLLAIIKKNLKYIKEESGVGKSFDILDVEVQYADRDMALFMVDGMIKDTIMHFIMKFLSNWN